MNDQQHEELIETLKNIGMNIIIVMACGIFFGSCMIWSVGNIITDKLHFVGETINHKDCR